MWWGMWRFFISVDDMKWIEDISVRFLGDLLELQLSLQLTMMCADGRVLAVSTETRNH